MNAVMISVPPNDCKLIANGVKNIILTKIKPKLETPFKCYIYETQGKLRWCNKCQDTECERPCPGCACYEGRGKVIGDFVCDKIITAELGEYYKIPLEATQIDAYVLMDYADDKTVYGWHISNLKIYDKPKSLNEFEKPCKKGIRFEIESESFFNNCVHCPCLVESDNSLISVECFNSLTQPPRSWCYIK